ncbi:hypothetical protein ACFVVP_07770 [Streptomyces sp. NPDC058128]|uniref:hypothetical protein n=1 Tax=unclassified Streptomyces TaxID=2593676 RepID=UPI00093DE95B|nr:hypothetical protein [Streptomyces sp. CB02009]OKJ61183.1 hypothetical protein AMK27_18690 [Streptomyces sp. CB02009]
MKRIFGIAAIIAGGVLALFFPDLEFGWFRGRPLGIVLVVIGGIELLESARGRKPEVDREVDREARKHRGHPDL